MGVGGYGQGHGHHAQRPEPCALSIILLILLMFQLVAVSQTYGNIVRSVQQQPSAGGLVMHALPPRPFTIDL